MFIFLYIYYVYKDVDVLKIFILCSVDGAIDAPPSMKPTKKYSDVSGLPVSNSWTKMCNVFSCENRNHNIKIIFYLIK